ncbi:MAG: RecBCD enzyme subunit RecC [Chlamydiae bacterium]|nr:RecBCD enzyme subunit RecC [Chlamydiota bacterium]
MERQIQVFFSNRVECLYSNFKEQLFSARTSPFTKRRVIVPSPAMKTWLMMQMADDSELGIAAGIKVSYLEPTLHEILQTLSANPEQIPKECSHLELALRIEAEIREVVQSKQELWGPLITYLQCLKGGKEPLNQKSERRLIALADKLALLFQQYGKFGAVMLRRWKLTEEGGWQAELWRRVLGETYPESFEWRSEDTEVHVFAMSYLSQQQHRILTSFSETHQVNYYLLSPCQLFWSDILSDREGQKLQKYWSRQGTSENQQFALEEYLYDRNPLLANFGRLGREMALQVEESGAITHEDYKNVHETNSLTLLEGVQSDMLLLRNPNSEKKIDLSKDDSFQVHVASSRMREVQILYDTILRIIERRAKDDDPICPEDFVVMAPDIMEYEPYIRAVFNDKESQLNCQIMDLHMLSQNSLIQGFFHLISLSFGRWDAASLLQLLEYPAFRKKHGITSDDVSRIRGWVQAADVRWGEDIQHREELLRKHHGSCSLVDKSSAGTWKQGMERLLAGMAMIIPHEEAENPELKVIPLPLIETTETELFGKWFSLMHSLREDLQLLSDGSRMSLREWSGYLNCLLEAYFEDTFDENNQQVVDLLHSFHFEKDLGGENCTFATIKYHLEAATKKQRACYRESHLHVVRFCSLLPMRAVPAKGIVLMGMEEGNFPRVDSDNSLNMLKEASNVDYCPTQADFDRYLFLETLLSARQYFIVTYTGYSKEDNKAQPPSLLVTELCSYLDKGYTIDGQAPSEYCRKHHPFQPYDKTLFTEDSPIKSYSKANFLAAKAFYNPLKLQQHSFIPNFGMNRERKTEQVEPLQLWQLALMARNPIEAYFNLTLGIYLEKEETRLVKTDEEFLLSALDRAILRKPALKRSLDHVLHRAEKEGRLPLGPFKNYGVKKLQSEVEEISDNLIQLGVGVDELIEIEFSDLFEEAKQTDSGSWQLPPLEVSVKGKPVKIVGSLKEVSTEGLIAFSKDDRKDVLKTWPMYLIYNCLVLKHQLPLKRSLLFAKSGKEKESFFSDPFHLLENYLEYYFHALENISPLIPEWTSDLLENDVHTFDKKIRQTLSGDSRHFYNEYMKWIVKGSNLPDAENILESWKHVAEKLFGELFQQWYPKKETKVTRR